MSSRLPPMVEELLPCDVEAKAPPPSFGKPPTTKSPPASIVGPAPRQQKAPPPELPPHVRGRDRVAQQHLQLQFVDRSDPKWRPKPRPPPLPLLCPSADTDPPKLAPPKSAVLALPQPASPYAMPKSPPPKSQLAGKTVRCHVCEVTYQYDDFKTETYCYVCRSDAISFKCRPATSPPTARPSP